MDASVEGGTSTNTANAEILEPAVADIVQSDAVPVLPDETVLDDTIVSVPEDDVNINNAVTVSVDVNEHHDEVVPAAGMPVTENSGGESKETEAPATVNTEIESIVPESSVHYIDDNAAAKPITQASMNDVATNLFSKYLISAEINARASIQLSRVASPETNGVTSNLDGTEPAESSEPTASIVEVVVDQPSADEPPVSTEAVETSVDAADASNIAEERGSLKESEYTEGSEDEEEEETAAAAAPSPPPRRKYSFEDDDLLAEADSIEEAAKADKAAAAALDTTIDDLVEDLMRDESLLDLDLWNMPPIADMVPAAAEEEGTKPKKAIKKKIKKKPAAAPAATDDHNRHHVKTANETKRGHPKPSEVDESTLYPHYSELVTGVYKRPIVISILVSKKQKKAKKRSATAPDINTTTTDNYRPSSPESVDAYSPAATGTVPGTATAPLEDSGVSDTDDPLHRDISSVVSVNENKPGSRGPRFKSFVVKAYDLVESKEAVTTVNLYDYNLLLEDIAIEHQTEAVLDYYQPASLPWWSKHLKKLVRVFVRHTGQLCVIVDRGLIKRRVREKMRYHSWLMESLQLQSSLNEGQQGTEVRDLPSVTALQNYSEFTDQPEPSVSVAEGGENGMSSPELQVGEAAIAAEEPSTVYDAVREEPSISNYQTSVDSAFNYNAENTLAHSESEAESSTLDFSGNWQQQQPQQPQQPQRTFPLPEEGAIIYENPSDAGIVLTEDESEGPHKKHKKKKKKAKKAEDPAHRRFKVVEPHPVVVLGHGQYHPKPLNEPVGGWNSDVHVPKTFSVIPRMTEPRSQSPLGRSAEEQRHHASSPSPSGSVSFSGSLISATPWNDNPNINPMKIVPRDPSPPRKLEASPATNKKKTKIKKQQSEDSLAPSQSMPVLVSTVPVSVPGLPHSPPHQQQHPFSKSHNDISLAEASAVHHGSMHRTAPSTSHGARSAEGSGNNNAASATPSKKKKRRVRPKTVPEPTEFLKPVTPPPSAALVGPVSVMPSPATKKASPKPQPKAVERSILDEMSIGSEDSFEVGGDGKTTEQDVFNAVNNLMFSLPQLKSTTASAAAGGRGGSVSQRSLSRQNTGGIDARRSSKLGSISIGANLDTRRNSTRLPSISGSFVVPQHVSSVAVNLLENQESPETAEVANKNQQKALDIIKGVRASFTANPAYKFQRMSFQEVKLLDSPFAKKIYYTPEETAAMNAAAERAIKSAIASNNTNATGGRAGAASQK